MQTIKSLLLHRLTIGFLCVLALIIFIFTAGPLFAFNDWRPLGTSNARWVSSLFVAGAWLIWETIRLIRRKISEKQLFANLLHPAPRPNDPASEEIDTLKGRFETALSVLKKSNQKSGQRFSLYELPWYLFIGPPGSGKTTALINSGLKFPLADAEKVSAVAGIGGTRYCDWWFTDQAVLIDTAGRYTTQDSHKSHDQGAWLGFLQLLKKYRPRRPINGVFIVISFSDLLTQSDARREQHVLSISQRLQELRDHLGINFPVYVLLTKTDLVSGFEEFFDNFDKHDREQIWGFTCHQEDRQEDNLQKNLMDGFNDLLRRLNERTLVRLQQTRQVEAGMKIASFPKQLQCATPAIVQQLVAIFDRSRYSHPLQLRGVFLTSGAQEGSPIDRLMNRLDPVRVAAPGGKGKSFFLNHFFEEVVFPEQALAGLDRALERKLRLMKTATGVGIVILTAVLALLFTHSYRLNHALTDTYATAIGNAEQAAEALGPTDTDPGRALPLLDHLRLLSTELGATEIPTQLLLGLPGLSQGNTLEDPADSAYLRALSKAFLARLMLDTEKKLASAERSDTYKYAALRTYLMLGSAELFDSSEVTGFYLYDWSNPGSGLSPEETESFQQHLVELFKEQPFPLPMDLNQELIDRVRRTLTAVSAEERILGRIERMDWQTLPEFSIYSAAGQELAGTVFVRKSGRPLDEGISPLYSKAVYQQLMAGELQQLIDEVVEENWVLDDKIRVQPSDRDKLFVSVRQLYLDNYRKAYEALLKDIERVPFRNFAEGAKQMDLLASAQSPLLQLLTAVAEQTRLTTDAPATPPIAKGAVDKALSRVKQLVGDDAGLAATLATTPQKDSVTLFFEPLNNLVTPKAEGLDPPYREISDQFAALYQYLASLSAEANSAAIDPALARTGQDIALNLRTLAGRQPELVVRPALLGAASQINTVSIGGVASHVNQVWNEDIAPFCSSAIEGRYPFDPNSNQEIALKDFGRFFGYGGMMDQFFEKHLRRQVDISASPWRVRAGQQGQIPIATATIRSFELAEQIKRAFFEPGAQQPSMAFRLTPVQADGGLRSFSVEIDGQSLVYEFGPLETTSLRWPGPASGQGSTISIRLTNNDILTHKESGDWAFFRQLDRAQFQRSTSSSESYQVRFQLSGYEGEYRLQTESVFNPLKIRDTMRFTCPGRI